MGTGRQIRKERMKYILVQLLRPGRQGEIEKLSKMAPPVFHFYAILDFRTHGTDATDTKLQAYLWTDPAEDKTHQPAERQPLILLHHIVGTSSPAYPIPKTLDYRICIFPLGAGAMGLVLKGEASQNNGNILATSVFETYVYNTRRL